MKKLLLLLVSSVIYTSANAASFDRKAVVANVEKMICNTKNLSRLDEEMLGTYRNTLSLTINPKKLKQDQREWIKLRNRCADEICLKVSYQSRIYELLNIEKQDSAKIYKEESWADHQKQLIIKSRDLGFCKKIAELYALGKLDFIISSDDSEAFKAKYNSIDIDADGMNDHVLVEGGARESLMTVTLSSGGGYEVDTNSTTLVSLQSKVYVLNYSPFIDNVSEKTYFESVDWLSPNGVDRVCEYQDLQR